MESSEPCPCDSGKPFGDCCGPILSGAAKAETAEALMRARYSAYATGEVAFLKTSATKAVQAEFDEETSREWARSARWHSLEIMRTEGGGPSDDAGVVEFRALYSEGGELCNHHEVAAFVRDSDGWKFSDGEFVKDRPVVREEPKVGRNDPCPCGSGKKYKKCCGRGA